MGKAERYGELVKNHISEIVEIVNRQIKTDEGEGVAHGVFDEQRHHYLLVKTGWRNGKRVRGVTLYVRIRDGRIHVEEDWTEEGIATALLQAGVPADDIVLAFHPPAMRQHTEFATA